MIYSQVYKRPRVSLCSNDVSNIYLGLLSCPLTMAKEQGKKSKNSITQLSTTYLEVKFLVTVEDQHKSSHLVSQSLH